MAIKEKPWKPLGKKHNWREGFGGFSFEMIIRDETGRKIDRFLWNTVKRFKEILELIRLKYDMG